MPQVHWAMALQCEGGIQCASGALGNGIKIRVEINIWIHDAHQEHGHH